MVGELIADKKIKIYNFIEEGTFKLTDVQGIVLTDLLISKKEGKTIFRVSDKKNSFIFLELNEPQTKHFKFDTGLSFWENANIELIKEKGEITITIGYYINERAKSFDIWSL